MFHTNLQVKDNKLKDTTALKHLRRELTINIFFSGNGSNMSEYTDYDIWDWYSTYYGQDFPEKAAADSIFIYVSPFLLLIGTVGNILSVIILQKLSHKVSYVFNNLILSDLLTTVKEPSRFYLTVFVFTIRKI